MKYQGHLHKMFSQLTTPVSYQLELSGQTINMHELLGKQLRLTYEQTINCVHCGRKTNKSFNQGYCYPCFTSLAQCDLCIMSPERCHYHLGTCREPEWGEANCMQPHVIYLSNTSGIKVGITRQSQIPMRWIDQGAVQALPILGVNSRYHSGLIETAFKKHLNDRTNWRKMLKNELEDIDLLNTFESLWPQVEPELDAEVTQGVEVLASRDALVDIAFPALSYPTKIISFNLDKQPIVEGKLNAIKGQYLIFDNGVINMRKYGGYLASLEVF